VAIFRGVAEIREGEVEVGGIRSPLIEAGPAAGEAVVFVHGNPGSRRDWEDLVRQVGEFRRAVAFDMPGFGGCRAPRGFDFRPEGYGRFLAEALSGLGVERAQMVVHDLGGPFTWPLIDAHPDLVRSVVAINTGMLDGRRWHRMARLWRRPVIGDLMQLAAPRAAFERALTAGGKSPLPGDFVTRMHRDYDLHTRRAVVKLYRAADLPYPAAAAWKKTLHDLDLRSLIVWGEKDPFVPEAAIQGILSAFPSAEVVRLPDSGHFPFADDPEATAAAVLPFLREPLSG
jgi:pimeloyl-ACP methyl ester carboxylesterase